MKAPAISITQDKLDAGAVLVGKLDAGAGSPAGNVPWIVENAVGGLAAEQTGSAVEMKNQTTQPHEEREA